MVQHKDEGYSVDPATRDDLDKALDKQSENIEKNFKLSIAPIIEELKKHETILTGASRMNGLVGNVKTMATNLKVIYGMLFFIGTIMVKKFFL